MTLLMAVALVASTLIITGCGTMQTPKAKSQDGSNSFRDINLGAPSSGKVVDDPAAMLVLTNGDYTVDQKVALIQSLRPGSSFTLRDIYLLEQVMSADSGDGETTTQTPTWAPSTPVNVSIPTGTDAITALVGAGAEGITKGIVNSGDGNAGAAAAVDPACPDGNCSDPVPK